MIRKCCTTPCHLQTYGKEIFPNGYAFGNLARMRAQNKPQSAQPLSLIQLQAIQEKLTRALEAVEKGIAHVTANPTVEFACQNVPSGLDGIARVSKLGTAIEDAVYSAQIGRPIKAGSLKPRSRLVAKAKDIVDEYRTSKGLSYVAENREKPTKKAPKKKE
jgi:hypothetical protein